MGLLRLCSPPKFIVFFRKTKALRSIHSVEQFHAILEREKALADRNTHHFSLVLFKISDVGEKVFQVRYLTHSLVNRIRRTDEIGWFDNKRIGVILPDTPAIGSQKFANSICEEITGNTSTPEYVVHTYPSASFPNGNGHSSQLSFKDLYSKKGGTAMG